MAKVFTQEYSLGYEETLARVAYVATTWTVLVVAICCRWHLHQMDVENAFFTEDPCEKVYMMSPFGLQHTSQQICRLT